MQFEKAAVKQWTVIFLMVSSVPAPVAASDAPVAPAGKHGVACVCVYYPHWHVYPKGNEWFHPGWTEWEYVKDAKPRYPNHKQPMVPYAGYLDESDPKDMAKEIALAANAGIDVFLWDYYWYDGQITQEEALDNGFLKASNRDRMKFAIMWCYHDRSFGWRPDIDQPLSDRRRLMSLAHTKEEFLGLIGHCIRNYFPRPEYWRKDGKLFFSIYSFRMGDSGWFFEKRGRNVAAIKAELDEARRMVREAGLGEMHFNIQNVSPKFAATMKACGFDSTTDYNITMSSLPDFARRCEAGEWLFDYAELPAAFLARYDEMAASPLPYIPNVTTGWDSTPRCRLDEPWPWRRYGYPYQPSLTNNTPDIFRAALAQAKKRAEEDPKKPGAVYINGWNEYTEGTYLIPNNFDSDGFLRAVASVFGRRPSGEYTFVDPITRKLFTVPSATFEDVAYGTHPKKKIDVYIPKKGKGPFPVVMYMHGGGWGGGAIVDRIVGAAIPGLLGRNVAVICTGYRYLRDAVETGARPPVMGSLDDCESALRFVKAHAAEWNLDTSRIGLAGGSAGACTALYLALKDDNMHGIKAVAPINAQTSMDPKEMREWIPNIKYGAHAFGYANFDDWLAHRSNCLADIERISPVALLRKVSPQHSPRFRFQYNAPLKPGELAKDPTHSPVFGKRFGEIAVARGIDCEVGYGSRNYFGDAFTWLADVLNL